MSDIAMHIGQVVAQARRSVLGPGLVLDSPGVIPADHCSVGGCEEASEATITIMGHGLRMCGDHARQIEGALERRQQA